MSEYTMEQVLRWDKDREEPYMVLPSFPELRLTPHRVGDDDEIIKLYNDPIVGSWAFRRPYPYLPEHLSFVWDLVLPGQKAAADDLKPLFDEQSGVLRQDAPPPKRICAFPFAIMRTSKNAFAGDVATWYAGRIPNEHDAHHPSEGGGNVEEKEQGKEEEPAAGFFGSVPEGIPLQETILELAYNVDPEWRRKGLGAETIALVKAWAKWMGVGKLQASNSPFAVCDVSADKQQAELKNLASQAVLRKSNFVLIGSKEQEWPEERGGGSRTLTEWEFTFHPAQV